MPHLQNPDPACHWNVADIETVSQKLDVLAGQDVPDHVVQRLQHHPNWLGVKECTGNMRIQSYADQGIMCWSGNDDEAHDGRHDHGAQVMMGHTAQCLLIHVRALLQSEPFCSNANICSVSCMVGILAPMAVERLYNTSVNCILTWCRRAGRHLCHQQSHSRLVLQDDASA